MIRRRVYLWLLESAVSRHDDLARALDYLADSRRTFLAMAALDALLAAVVDPLSTLFIGFIVLARQRRWVIYPVTVAIWEVNVWFSVLTTAVRVAGVVVGGLDLAVLLSGVGHLLIWIVFMYLVVDAIMPPRKRKRRVRKRSRVRAYARI